MSVLVDIGAAKDILFDPCFRSLGLSNAHLKPTKDHLEGFTNHKVTAKIRGRTMRRENLESGDGKIHGDRHQLSL